MRTIYYSFDALLAKTLLQQCFISLAECLGTGDDDELTNTLSRYYETIVMALIQTGENPAMDPNTRASCYEAIATVTCYSAKDVHPALQNLAVHVLDRLEKTIATQAQLLGGDDRRAHHEIQANLCNVLTSVLRKLNKEISPAADRIMQDVLTVMSGASAGSTVMEDAFLVVGALTSCKPFFRLCSICFFSHSALFARHRSGLYQIHGPVCAFPIQGPFKPRRTSDLFHCDWSHGRRLPSLERGRRSIL